MDGTDLLRINDRLWAENQHLQEEVGRLRRELARQQDLSRQLQQAEAKIAALTGKNTALRRQLRESAERLKSARAAGAAQVAPPLWVKANVPSGPKKRPGRKAGHAPAVRPMPETVDVHQQVPLGVDGFGKPCCPDCRTQLSDVAQHERIVEEIIPARAVVTCYHTISGFCPSCRKKIESRASEQPPAPPGVDLPHGQLGLNALVMAAVLRVCYRLPMRQITRLYGQLPGLKVSPGAVARQLQRLAGWLEDQYHRLKLSLRLSGVVYADETSWRTDGKNAQLWTLTDGKSTLYHIDRSRSGKVIAGLLGEHFNADGQSTLVSDFYAAYDQFDGPQQKCLAHLLRELKETVEQKPELKDHPFFTRSRRLIREMLALRARRENLDAQTYQDQVNRIDTRLERLGRPPPVADPSPDPDVQRLRKRLAKYRGKLTTFLHRSAVDPTNNAAERAIRPAVIMRKNTGGSRSPAGARAWAVLASVMRTAEQHGQDVVATLRRLLMAEWDGQIANLLE